MENRTIVLFVVFLGTTNLSGGITKTFIAGIDSALYVSLALLAIAGALSLRRGKEVRTDVPKSP